MEKKIIRINDIDVRVFKKNIKNFYLSVLPPDGKVRVSVPRNIGLKNISKHFKNKKGKLKENMFLGKAIILRVGDTF